jgi:hypothetical protein
MNLLGDNIDAIKKNMETYIDASKEVGLEVNTDKTKYMLLSRRQNARQNYDIKILFLFIFFFVCEAIGTAAIPGLLCQPRVIVKMIVEKQMECRLAGETEVLGEHLPQHHFCPSQNST